MENIFSMIFFSNREYIGGGRTEIIKWKALSVKAKANKGLFREIEAEELLAKQQKSKDFHRVKTLIQGDRTKQEEMKRAAALASVAGGGGGGSSSSKNAKKLKNLLSQSEPDPDDSKSTSKNQSHWAKLKAHIAEKEQNFPSPNRSTVGYFSNF